MGKASVKENKNRYFQAREDLELTRAEASERLGVISEDRLEKIENERIAPQPYDVLAMAKAYDNAPFMTDSVQSFLNFSLPFIKGAYHCCGTIPYVF